MYTDTELYRHSKRELDLLLDDERKNNLNRPISDLTREVEVFHGKTMQEFINDEVLNIIGSINPKIHSKYSIKHVFDLVSRLILFENILPLTLEDSEFIKVSEENGDTLYQNIRNINVFKSSKKGVYHLEGREALDLATWNFKHTGQPERKQLSIFDYDENGEVIE